MVLFFVGMVILFSGFVFCAMANKKNVRWLSAAGIICVIVGIGVLLVSTVAGFADLAKNPEFVGKAAWK